MLDLPRHRKHRCEIMEVEVSYSQWVLRQRLTNSDMWIETIRIKLPVDTDETRKHLF